MLRSFFYSPTCFSACIFGCGAGRKDAMERTGCSRAATKGYRLHQGAMKVHILYDRLNEGYYFSTLPILLTFHRLTSLASPIFNTLSSNSNSAITTS
jgi:hypothetical protein